MNFLRKWKRWIIGFMFPTALAAGGGVIDAQINPYTDTGTKLEIAKVSTLEDAGQNKIELVKSEPKAIFKKWNGEVAMGIKYNGIQATGDRAFMTDRVEWKSAKEEMHAYPLEAKAGMEDGGFEIEVVLNEKPATNKFDFTIDGAENLDFFYQPELTQKEINEGASRPDNVIGSYAVYHKQAKNHVEGRTNYATGKAYHIYRPKVVDANGAEQWAELSYDDNGTLSVTVPQGFLDTAVYPVKVDPTFGITSLGGSAGTFCNSSSSVRRGTAFLALENGTLTSISVSMKMNSGSDTTDTTAFVSQEDSGGSGTHGEVAKKENLNVSLTTTASFQTFTLSSGTVSAGTNYIVNAICDDADIAANNAQITVDTVSAAANKYSETYAAPGYTTGRDESPWTKTANNFVNLDVLYATYTADASNSCTTWWNSAYQNRRKITFNNAPANFESFSSFPMPIKLTEDANDEWSAAVIDYSKTMNHGFDVRFVDEDCTTQLDHEIEEWDETGTSTAWVRVPVLTGGATDDHIWMYYNNTSVTSSGAATTSVWTNASFTGVYHLTATTTPATQWEDSSGVTGTLRLTDANGTGVTVNAAGLLGKGVTFGGTDTDYMSKATAAFSSPPGTICSVYKTASTVGTQGIATVGGADGNYHGIAVEGGSAGDPAFAETKNGGTSAKATTANGTTVGKWQYVCGTWTTSAQRNAILNAGASVANTTDTSPTITGTGIGALFDGNPASPANGTISEVRYSNVVRTADWIQAEYRYGFASSTTHAFAGEETVPAAGGGQGDIKDHIDTAPIFFNGEVFVPFDRKERFSFSTPIK